MRAHGIDVRLRRRADVAPLHVGDHEQARLACVCADAFEGAHALPAARLEERRLRLDRDRMLGDCVDDLLAERFRVGDAIGKRVEPDHELRALPRTRFVERVGEVRQLCLPADLSELPAENFGTRAAGISTFSVGLRGLTPVRAARCCVVNLPNPVNATSPPALSVSVIVSRNASTALPASRAVSWLRRATSATNSCLVTCLSSCLDRFPGRKRPYQGW